MGKVFFLHRADQGLSLYPTLPFTLPHLVPWALQE